MSLYQLERTGDVQELIGYARRSDKPEIRARAAELLGNFSEHDERADVVRALVDVTQNDDHAEVSAAAVDALDRLGGDAIEQLIADAVGADLDGAGADWVKAQAFVKALSADLPELRMAAANGLGQLEHTDAVPRLVERFGDRDPRVRARAARACGFIADPRATGALEDLLTDSKPKVRRAAAKALGNVGNRQALAALLPLYRDDDERVRRVAVGAFGNFGNEQPVEYLVESLTDDASVVRRTAVYSLVELLANVPTDQSHDIRETVVAELSETDDPSVVVPLVEILEESQQQSQRRNTAWLLGRVTEDAERDRVVEALVSALRAEDTMTAQFAATSLAELGGEAVERRLLELVDDQDAPAGARAQAVFALGKVGGERSRERLGALLDETENDDIRQRAFSALSKLGGRT